MIYKPNVKSLFKSSVYNNNKVYNKNVSRI